MHDFKIVKKIGNLKSILFYLGEGAFSQVYRVIRVSDNLEYALKQVNSLSFNSIGQTW